MHTEFRLLPVIVLLLAVVQALGSTKPTFPGDYTAHTTNREITPSKNTTINNATQW